MTVLQYLEDFDTHPLRHAMLATVENSPWHREDNVWVHTIMTLTAYALAVGERTDAQNAITTLALLFHDTGKPKAMAPSTRADGSTHPSFAGHEQMSAAIFMSEYVKCPRLRGLLTVEQARKVRWIIEHHLPYGPTRAAKMNALVVAAEQVLGDDLVCFYDVLQADAAGRVSDDHQAKLKTVADWMVHFAQIKAKPVEWKLDAPKVYMMVGPSGSGKSTYVRNALQTKKAEVFSMDNCKLRFADELNLQDPDADAHTQYAIAHEIAEANADRFFSFWRKELTGMLSRAAHKKQDVYIDLVNGRVKDRALFIDEAKRVGLNVVGVEFWNTEETLQARQKTRLGKTVPEEAVTRQFWSCCSIAGVECSSVEIILPSA